VSGVRASYGDLEILKGVDIEVPFGEVHVLMGPNGSGKSTLCHVLMGKDEYDASGSALVDGTEVMGLPVDERAQAGLFEAFQYPVEIPGVSLNDLLREMGEVRDDPDFDSRVESAAATLDMERFRERAVNGALSGGEKKRSEMFQMAVAGPKVAILDEIDSGLDIDAVREVAHLVEELRSDDHHSLQPDSALHETRQDPRDGRWRGGSHRWSRDSQRARSQRLRRSGRE
jgi:Fe-S cluster assembly ATP-binding protein